MRKLIIITVLFSFILAGCSQKPLDFSNGKIEGVNTISDLDKKAVFSFAVMSDNKGDSPADSEPFKRMSEWIKHSNAQFIIGLGDHVKKGWKNSFLEFVKNNQFWQDNFYPNVADGENEYYGEGQGDWGSGAPIIDEVNISKHDFVKIRENKCEYYAAIPVKDYTVHLIQLHFSDTPAEDSIAFNESTKKYLIETLNSINKGKKDIIIAAAHSREGVWIQDLSEERQKIVMSKCDLILSATTHFFKRFEYPDFGEKSALVVNTGSMGYASSYCPEGYLEIHVLENPVSLVVQYINGERENREMQQKDYAYIKVLNGKTYSTDFRPQRDEENMDLTVCSISKDYSKEEMMKAAEEVYRLAVPKADEIYAAVPKGLEKGSVSKKDLWSIFPYNNEIYRIDLTKDEVNQVFRENKIDMKGKDILKLGINGYNGDYLISKFEIPEDRFVKSGKTEIEMFKIWLKNQK